MHFSNLLCHASMHSWKDSSQIARSSLVTYCNGFWILKASSFDDFLECGKQTEVTRGKIWIAGWLLQYSNVIFAKKLPNSQGIMSWSIVMMKQPWPRFPQFSSFLPHRVHQTSQDVFVDVLINSLALWQKFCVDNSMDINKRSASPWFWTGTPSPFWVLMTMRSSIQNSVVWWVGCTRRSMTHRQ